MSEARALILFAAVYLVAVCLVTLIAIGLGAGGTALGFLLVFVCGAGGYLSSAIVSRYAELRERRKREKILLSR